MARIVMTSIGSVGNAVPFAAIGTALQSRGHDVAFATNHVHAEAFRSTPITFETLDTIENYRSFLDDGKYLNRPSGLPLMFRRYYLPCARVEIEKLSKYCGDSETVIVANEAPGIAARILAEKYSVPLVSVLTYPNHFEASAVYEELIAGVLRDEINELRSSVGLRPRNDLVTWWRSADRYLALWPTWFHDKSPQWPPRTRAVGFIYGDTGLTNVPPVIQAFLDRGSPNILVTGGTAMFAGDDFWPPILESLDHAKARAVVVARYKSPALARAASDRICWVSEVPSLTALMRRVQAVVHHGGMGTIGQAFLAGVPQVVLADGGDRPYNAERVQALRAGLQLPRPDWTVSAVVHVLRQVLEVTTYRESSERLAALLATSNSTAEAASIVERMSERVALAQSCMARREDTPSARKPPTVGAQPSNIALQLSPERRALLASILKRERTRNVT